MAMALAFALQLLAGAMCFMPKQAMADESAMPHCHGAAAPLSPVMEPVLMPPDMDMSGMSLQQDQASSRQQSDHQACVHCDAPDAYVASLVTADLDVSKVLLAVVQLPDAMLLTANVQPAAHWYATAPPLSSLPVYLTTQRFRL